jgi:hypothetical protein
MQKAWPLIGSLTRTVDYLQLTVEPSASRFSALMNPLKLVQPTDAWTELEERRRVFWVIFLLDRYAIQPSILLLEMRQSNVHEGFVQYRRVGILVSPPKTSIEDYQQMEVILLAKSLLLRLISGYGTSLRLASGDPSPMFQLNTTKTTLS